MVCIKQKRPVGLINKGYLAETKGDSAVREKPINPNRDKGLKGVHVVKTCGEIHKSRPNTK